MATAAVLILLAALLPALAAATDDRWPACDCSGDMGTYAPGSAYEALTPKPNHTCGDMGTYAPGSAYEAALRHLVATIPAKVSSESCKSSNNCTGGFMAGKSPNLVYAHAYCPWNPDAKSPDCGACIALAFQEAQRLCPQRRQAEAMVNGGACSVAFHDYDIMEFYAHGDPRDLLGSTRDEGVIEENEDNTTRMRWACRILETAIMEIFEKLWISNIRICA